MRDEVEFPFDPPGMNQKLGAGGSQFDALVRPNEQLLIERPLQLCNPNGQCRLRDIARFRRPGEVSLINDREEIAQQIAI